MKIFITKAALLLSMVSVCSCEQMLDINPPQNEMVTDQVFEDPQTANAALENLYYRLWNNSILSGAANGMGAVLGSYADDFDCYYSSNNGGMELYLNQPLPTNPMIEKMWNSSYQIIYAANLMIEKTDASTGIPQANKDLIKGEALFIRTLLYFYLQQLFDEIPYTVSTDYIYNSQVEKLTKTELLNKAEADLVLAVSLLKDNYRNSNRIYPNRKVAQLLLAKVYLLNGKWAAAEEQCRTVLQFPGYQFENNLQDVFHHTGTHILWQLAPQYAGQSTQEAPFFYFENSAPNAYAVSAGLFGVFDAGDLRKTKWIDPVQSQGQVWYRYAKYKNIFDNENEYSVLNRLEEVYFVLAESLAEQGRTGEALPYLNYTRQRAGLLPLTGTYSRPQLLAELLLEKRKEFFGESGMRFFDLKRLGRLDDLKMTKPNWQDFHRTLPLPQKELVLNPNLNPQNAGY